MNKGPKNKNDSYDLKGDPSDPERLQKDLNKIMSKIDSLAKDAGHALVDQMRKEGVPNRVDRSPQARLDKETRRLIFKEAIRALRDIARLFKEMNIELPNHSREFLEELVSNPFLILKVVNLNPTINGGYMDTSDEIYLNLKKVNNKDVLRFVLTHEILHALSTKPLFEGDSTLRSLKADSGLNSFGRKFNEAVTEHFALKVAHNRGVKMENILTAYIVDVEGFISLQKTIAEIMNVPYILIVRFFASAYLNTKPELVEQMFVDIFTNTSVPDDKINQLAELLYKLGVNAQPYIILREIKKNL